MSRNWMSDWEADRDEFEESLQRPENYTPIIEPYLKEKLKPQNERQGFKYGETQYGQLTLFPAIDEQQKKKISQENTR